MATAPILLGSGEFKDLEAGNTAPAQEYDATLAEMTEDHERDMTFKAAMTADKRLIWYSLGFSGTIIMEGYGLALITYLFAFSEFNQTYGEYSPVKKEYEVRRYRHFVVPVCQYVC
jgi:MFS transporter, SP family, general alpha glucoside:H+ symporter